MKSTKTKISVPVLLLIVAIFLLGCGSDKEDSSAEVTNVEESITVVAADDTAANEAVTTDKAADTKKKDKTEQASKDDESTKTDKRDSDAKKNSSSSNSNSSSSSSSKDSKSSSKKSKPKSSDSNTIKVSVSIDCKTLYEQDPTLANKVSSKGVIYGKKTLTINKNSSVRDALKKTGIIFSGSDYITTINGLSEKDGGKLSGWMYKVNGKVPMESCDDYKLKNGDTVQWRYTCESGEDI